MKPDIRARLSAVLCLVTLVWVAARAFGATEPAPARDVTQFKIDHEGQAQRGEIERGADGQLVFRMWDAASGSTLTLSPTEFAEMLAKPPQDGNWLMRLLNISTPAGMLWVGLGLAGQVLFTGRMLVQWIASERRKQSVVPVAFWWLSLGGALMLVTYFTWRRDAVGVIGQSTGIVIYLRNLVLIRRLHAKAVENA